MPDPDLPDLKVQPLSRIALDENGGLHDFSWQALNLGDVNAPASDYKIYLSGVRIGVYHGKDGNL